MDRPFLQTVEWLAFQKSLGRKVWRLDDGFIKANIIQYNVRLRQNFLYVPYGPELNLDMAKQGLRNEISHFRDTLKSIAHHEKSMFVKLEPTHDLAVELMYRNGVKLKKSYQYIQPMRTTVVDLTQSRDTLLDKMHHKHRYNINLAERKGVTMEESRDAESFWKLLKTTAERDKFRSHPMLYYKKLLNFFSNPDGHLHTRLYLAHHGGTPVAGVLVMEHGKTVHYLHGASNREHRAVMAPHLLHWSLIQQYQERGFECYDFWGVDSQKWPGMTRFKFGFGGTLVEYPGSFDIVMKRFWRWLYNNAPR